jgi:hypothetical protein
MSEKTLLINRKHFVDWIFDYDDKKDFFQTYEVGKALLNDGVFTLSIDDLISNVGYLPVEVAEKGQDLSLDEEGDINTADYDLIAFSSTK